MVMKWLYDTVGGGWAGGTHGEHDLEDEIEQMDADQNGWARFGNYVLVGNGFATNGKCGKYLYEYGCTRINLHNRIMMAKIRVRGKETIVSTINRTYHKPVFNYCNNPRCPICYKHGWASRLARKIEHRFLVASKKFGQPEHIIVPVPAKDFRLSLKDLRAKVVRILRNRGVIGGVQIFHGFRYANAEESRRKNVPFGWYWSIHFHVIGFILGGYKCRDCKKKCFKGCGGFVDRSYRENEKDGYIVKVKAKRETIWGTARYQLDHATVDLTKKRFKVATYFGCISYRKLKVTEEMKHAVCPCCKHDLDKLRYVGNREFCHDRNSPNFRREAFDPHWEGGIVVWIVIESKGWRSGNYRELTVRV